MSSISANSQALQPEAQYLDVERALAQVGDLPALHDMLDMLQMSLHRDIPHIERLLSQDKLLLANRVLHALKGVIPIFCCDALCKEVARVEKLSTLGSPQEVGVAYALLSPKLKQLQTEANAYLRAV